MWQAIRDGKYKTKLKYPEKVEIPAILTKKVCDLARDEIRQIDTAMLQHEMAKEKYNAAVKAYHDDENRLMAIFQNDLEVEYGTVGNHRAGVLFGKAWELGHAHGLDQVHCHYADLVDLIR